LNGICFSKKYTLGQTKTLNEVADGLLYNKRTLAFFDDVCKKIDNVHWSKLIYISP
jgi:hypothetical protein